MSNSPNYPMPHCEIGADIPAQVEVAFDTMRWANGREFSPKERAVYEAALEVVRLYLTGEMTFDESQKPPEEKSKTIVSLWGDGCKMYDEAVKILQKADMPFRVCFTKDYPGTVVLSLPFGDICGLDNIKAFVNKEILPNP